MKEQCRNYSSTRGLPHTKRALVLGSPLAQALRMCKLYVGSPVGASAPRNRRRVAPHKPWRERRWLSFIIWRWAGPARVGWTHCPQRVLLLLLLPRRPRHPSILKSLPRPEGRAKRAGHVAAAGLGVVGPGGSQPSGRPKAAAGSRLAKAPRRAPGSRPRSRADRPSGAGAARPGRAPAARPAPAAASPLGGRAPDVPRRAGGPRKGGAAGGVSPAGPTRRRSLSAQYG
jgi:hypothetical protein